MVDFKELRNRIGLTQAELAEKACFSETTIQNWESLKIIPRGENLNKYLDALEINNPVEREKIAGEIAGVTKGVKSDVIDNIPYFLFPEDSHEIAKIKECYATADELDMLAYVDYVSVNGRASKRDRRGGAVFQLEFAFFEKYGGYNMTRKKVSDVRKRLGSLYVDALEFAENNPGCDYRLASLDKTVIVDRIAKYLNKDNYQNKVDDLYDYLKTIEAVDKDFSGIKNLNVRLEKTANINKVLQNNYNRTTGECNLGSLTGYVELEMENPQDVPNISNLKLTERGKQYIQWGNLLRGI